MELRDQCYIVTQEVARLLHYTRENGKTIQLPHDIRGREDLVLPDEKLILELKQTRTMDDKEHMQLMRYMRERCAHPDWGATTQGMLINFGDDEVEIWWMYFPECTSPHTPHSAPPASSPFSWGARVMSSHRPASPPHIARVCLLKEKLPQLSEKHPQFKLPSVHSC